MGFDPGAGDETVVVRCDPNKEPVVIDERDGVPICHDLDGDCAATDHLDCYLCAPGRGRCPFLSAGRLLNSGIPKASSR